MKGDKELKPAALAPTGAVHMLLWHLMWLSLCNCAGDPGTRQGKESNHFISWAHHKLWLPSFSFRLSKSNESLSVPGLDTRPSIILFLAELTFIVKKWSCLHLPVLLLLTTKVSTRTTVNIVTQVESRLFQMFNLYLFLSRRNPTSTKKTSQLLHKQ